MSVPASEKKKSKVEFMNNGQNLLISVGNWVTAQKTKFVHNFINNINSQNIKNAQDDNTQKLDNSMNTMGLDHFFNLISKAFIYMSIANSTKITDIDTYMSRLDNFRKAKSLYRTAREYMTVVAVLHPIKKNKKIEWGNFLYFIDIELDGIIKYDKKVVQKVIGKFNKTAKALNDMLDEYNRRQLSKRAKIQNWKTEQIIKESERNNDK